MADEKKVRLFERVRREPGLRRRAAATLIHQAWAPGRTWDARLRTLICLARIDFDAFEEEARWLAVAAAQDDQPETAHRIRELCDQFREEDDDARLTGS